MKNITNIMEKTAMDFKRNILALAVVVITLMSSGCGQGGQQLSDNSERARNKSILSKSWNLAWHLDAGGIQFDKQEVAANDSGNIVAVWKQTEDGVNSIMAATYDASEDYWSPPVNIGDVNITDPAFEPKVAMGAEGNVVVAWTQLYGGRFNILANSFDQATGTWGNAVEIDSSHGSHAFLPRVVMDASGNAMAVWYQHDGARYSIYSNIYNAQDGGWGVPELVEKNDAGDANHPQIDGNGSGVVVVTWIQFDGQRDSAWTNRYDPVAGSWGSAEAIENNNTDHVNEPVVAVNNAGDAIVSWYMREGEFYRIYVNRYDSKTSTWGEAFPLEDAFDGNSYTPVAGIDDNANIIIAWVEDNGTTYALNTKRYDSQSGTWAATVQLDSGESGDAENPRISIDPDGNAVVVWQRYSVSCKVKGARYDLATDSWGGIESLCEQIINSAVFHGEIDTSTVNVYDPRITFDRNGRAVVIWKMSSQEGDCIMVSTLS